MPLVFMFNITKYTITVIFQLISALPASCVKQDMYHIVCFPFPSRDGTFKLTDQCEAKLTEDNMFSEDKKIKTTLEDKFILTCFMVLLHFN